MPEKVCETDLINALTGVFRTHGYEGASMTRISEATGLKKSSLYHRFPGGKQQMAAAVAEAITVGVEQEVLAPLRAGGTPQDRVRKAGERLAAFYEDGSKPCVLDTLSITAEQGQETRQQLMRSYESITAGFTAIAIEAGLAPKEAKQRASRAVVLIEGALVISRVTGDNLEFAMVMDELPALLTGR